MAYTKNSLHATVMFKMWFVDVSVYGFMFVCMSVREYVCDSLYSLWCIAF